MKKNKFKILIFVIIILFIVLAIILNRFLRKDKYANIKSSLENVFFYLKNDYYNDMNDISDDCKIALIYNTKYLKSDYSFYNTNGKKILGYTNSNVLSTLSKIIPNATINFNLNINNTYDFLMGNDCIYTSNMRILTYDNESKVFYSNNNEESNRLLIIKWNNIDDADSSNIKLYASALMIVKDSNKYDLYIDNNLEYLIGSYSSLKKAKSSALKNFNRSYDYIITLERKNNNYIWKSFERKTFNTNIVD